MAAADAIAYAFKAIPALTDYPLPSRTAARVPIYLFDDSTSKTLYFLCAMAGYDNTADIILTLPWKFTTFAGSQTCDWEASIARIQDDVDSIESLSFATAQTLLATEASATGELDYADITFTNAQADGIQNNELFMLRVVRDATGGTASPGDAELTWPLFRAG